MDVVVTLSGDIDLASREATLGRLDAAVTSARAAGANVVVDLSGVTFLDSTGMSCLVIASRGLRGVEGSLYLSNPPPMVRRVLEIAGLTKMIRDEPV
jgi:anti-anti-sigma factor